EGHPRQRMLMVHVFAHDVDRAERRSVADVESVDLRREVVARGAEGRRRRYVDGVAVDGDPFRETGGRRDRGQDVRVADSGLGRRRGAHASGKEKRQGDQKRGDGEGGKGWAAAHHAPPDWYFRIPICQAVFLESSPEWVISLGGVSVRGQRDGGWARVLL